MNDHANKKFLLKKVPLTSWMWKYYFDARDWFSNTRIISFFAHLKKGKTVKCAFFMAANRIKG